MSIETGNCTYNEGKMCRRGCFKEALLDTQAREGGSASPDPSAGEFEPGPYMTESHWAGLIAQVLAKIETCGQSERVQELVKEWNAVKRDPNNGFLQNTGSSTLPSGWYTGSDSK